MFSILTSFQARKIRYARDFKFPCIVFIEHTHRKKMILQFCFKLLCIVLIPLFANIQRFPFHPWCSNFLCMIFIPERACDSFRGLASSNFLCMMFILWKEFKLNGMDFCSNFLCIVFTQKEREYQQENILCVLTFYV